MKRRTFVQNSLTALAGAIAMPTIVPSHVFGKNAPGNNINVGQIGCGRIARSHDMPGTMQYDIIRMTAVCDVDSKRAQEGKALVEQYYAEKTGKTRWDLIKEMRQTFQGKKLLVAVAGGITPETAPEALANGANIIIVGRYITQSKDVERATREFLKSTREMAEDIDRFRVHVE